MGKVRKNQDKGKWIPSHIREELDRLWQDPKWLEKSRKNIQNRKSEEGLSPFILEAQSLQ